MKILLSISFYFPYVLCLRNPSSEAEALMSNLDATTVGGEKKLVEKMALIDGRAAPYSLDSVFSSIMEFRGNAAMLSQFYKEARTLIKRGETSSVFQDPLKAFNLLVELLDCGQRSLAQWVIEHCVDTKHIFTGRLGFYTWLDSAIYKDHFLLAQKLLDKDPQLANIRSGPKDWLPVHIAAGTNSDQCFYEYLIAKGAEATVSAAAATSNLNRPPPYNDAERKTRSLSPDSLARRTRTELMNAKTKDGYTPLMLASMRGFTKQVKCILGLRAQYNLRINLQLSDGYTAVDLVTEQLIKNEHNKEATANYMEIYNLLFQAGGRNHKEKAIPIQ